ncbi:GPI ethanolamine phosphate transferase 3 isoform X2 [Folsomia candida]|uniref:GPI ethanolamine phosphate transferase 3 isoform X2 n=1 Tax=Folsomia candida TaxID=158441 RepID=UPI0016053CE1|nr:GPI ethanolamine phosphate transferase 3 isoform X2 [Folsomia candida]
MPVPILIVMKLRRTALFTSCTLLGNELPFWGTIPGLFPQKYFKSRFVEAHPSFNAWDLDTVDKAVNKTMQEIFLTPHKDDWDILISHLLGVDHCGHRYGPSHPEMARKLHEADSIIKHVFNSMSNDTLLVIFGDHGMTATGDHGGDSKDETESAVIFISKQFYKYNSPFQCAAELAISQIDLVPTIALLLGIPIPYSSIGQVIPAFLQNKINSDAIAANVAQVNKYIQNFPSMLTTSEKTTSNVDNSNLIQQYKLIQEAYEAYKSFPNLTSREKLRKSSEMYLKQVKSVAVSTWTQFNLPMIYTGVCITFLSVTSLIIYLSSVPFILRRRSSITSNYPAKVLSWLLPSLSHWSVLCTFVYHSISSSALLGIIVSTISGLVVFLLFYGLILFRMYKRIFVGYYYSRSREYYFSSFISVGLYVFTCLAMFSNSFTVYEGYMLGFALSLVSFIEVASSSRTTTTTIRTQQGFNFASSSSLLAPDNLLQTLATRKILKCSWSCFIILLILVRISFIFFRCREEQTTCSEEFLLHKQLASLPEDWLVHKYLRYGVSLLALAIFVVSFRHWMIYRCCKFSKKPRAIIARFIPSLLVVLLGVFWALQGLPYISCNASKIPLLMNYLPLVYQVVTVSAILCVSWKPICCIGHLKHLPYTNFSKLGRNQRVVNNSSKTRVESSRSTKPENYTNGVGHHPPDHPPQHKPLQPRSKLNTTIVFPFDIGGIQFCDCSNEDTYSSCFLTLASLITLLLVQVTSTGIVPAIILQAYVLVCLVGIFQKPSVKNSDSWSSAVAWTLTSQYFFYATGHQPIFSAIPWDSAFVGGGGGDLAATSPGAWLSWLRAGLAVIGNLHVSQVLTSITLPLLIHWSVDKRRVESLMGKSERQMAYILYGKYLALHGLKLLVCMGCAGWHRRHLMVWKIFAPKFIFEAVSFIITSSVSLLGMVFLTRVSYCHQKYLDFSQTA